MARILLIKPLQLVHNFEIVPPLGPMYLASTLAVRGGHEVRIVDDRLRYRDPSSIRPGDAVRDFRPDVIGITGLTTEADSLHWNAARVKAVAPETPVVAGGPYASSVQAKALDDSNIDLVVCGEGEEAMLEVVDAVVHGKPLRRIAGTAWREEGRVVHGPARPPITDLDSIPHPAWDLLDMAAYWKAPREKHFYRHRAYMAVFTSRGCPYRCIYCHGLFGRRFRARSPENVIEELSILYRDYGVREIQIQDDTFNLSAKRAKAICAGLAKSPVELHLSFPNGLRGDIMDDELISLLKRAGTYAVHYAVETASPRLQRLIRKDLDLTKLRRVIARTAGEGILTSGYFMLGFPDETREEMAATVAFARESRLHMASFFVVKAYEGTALAEMAGGKVDNGRSSAQADYYRVDAGNLSAVPAPEAEAILKRAYLGFYLSPGRIVRILKVMPNRGLLLRFAAIFLRRVLGRV